MARRIIWGSVGIFPVIYLNPIQIRGGRLHPTCPHLIWKCSSGFEGKCLRAFLRCNTSFWPTSPWPTFLSTLISLINVEARLLILKKKFHPPRTFPPSTIIDCLDFFHPPLHVYCVYVIVFSKKSHPTRLFQPPRLLILQLLHSLHVYSNLHGY